jgi:hypothetical protein
MDEERGYLISQLINEGQTISLSTEFRNHIVDVLSSPNLPIHQLRILTESDISFFASGPNILGQVLELHRAIGRIVYLSSKLLEQPSDIKAVIAHELAHVLLGHGEESSPTVGRLRRRNARRKRSGQVGGIMGFSSAGILPEQTAIEFLIFF